MNSPVPNFLTFDIEEWWHVNYPGLDLTPYRDQPTALEANVERLIQLCGRHNVRTTCFVLSSVAERKPGVVRALRSAGHEIASHGHAHESVFDMSRERFREEIRRSCGTLEDIAGERVLGFRAPSFSVVRGTLPMYYEVLEEHGLLYSSSVFPGRTFLYGIPDFPPTIHQPAIDGRRSEIVEIPVPAVKLFGRTIGLYVRLFPARMLAGRIRRDNAAGRPVTLYVHPREIDPDQPRLPLPFPESTIHYWGIRGCERRLDVLLRRLPGAFGRMGDAVRELRERRDPET